MGICLDFFFINVVQLIALTSWKVRSMASVSICIRKAHRAIGCDRLYESVYFVNPTSIVLYENSCFTV